MTEVRTRHTVAIVGAGAAGTLTAVHLLEAAARRRTPLDLVLIDPAPEAGRGTAYATADPRHRLNVPAGGMSGYPDDPGHFVRWLCRHGEPTVTAADFATRYRYGAYLADTLGQAIVHAHGTVTVRRLRSRAVRCAAAPGGRVELGLADGEPLIADSAVLATGPAAPTAAWAPPALRSSPRFVAAPWAPGALDGPTADVSDVLLVGTGLTAVDLALTLDRPGRTVHALSRSGLLPQPHALGPAGPVPVPEGLTGSPAAGSAGSPGSVPGADVRPSRATDRPSGADVRPSGAADRPSGADAWPSGAAGVSSAEDRMQAVVGPDQAAVGPERAAAASERAVADPGQAASEYLARLRRVVYGHVSRSRRTQGDWRPAVDSLRPYTARLWRSLTPEERAEFLAREGALWNTHRHRMAPATAERVDRARTARRLRVHTGTVTSVTVHDDGPLTVELADGRTLRVGWVVDCTGPGGRADDPLWRSLFASGAAVPGPLGLGVATRDGRLQGRDDRAELPLFTLGSARRGELWETTAVPEIRVQAAALAEELLAPLTPRRRSGGRRPGDGHGLPLSTHAAAAAAHRRGLDRVLKVRSGARECFERAVELDPGFALGHAALALLGHECGAPVDVPRSLARARRGARERADERERSFVDVVTRRVHGDDGDAALLRHLENHPADALALAAAVPTIAFSGVADLDDDYALGLLRRTAPAHDGHWFHTSLLAFLRQEQGRLHEAGELAHRALAAEPASGHAVHALAHVHYESGAHEAGRDWLDGWVGGHGRGAVHRAHFSWHIALHELALDDPEAVRRRWRTQLAPGRVNGVRALVDSGSLLWRARLSGTWPGDDLPVADVLDAVAREVVERPATAFTALHAAVALTAAGDLWALRRLRDHAAGADATQREVIAPLCDALGALVEERFAEAARGLSALLPVLRRVGGSAAQREVVEETLLYALLAAGHGTAARHLLDTRLDRRTAPRDRRLLAALDGARSGPTVPGPVLNPR
ncbi:FAD/NAD(P)-binding protein [Streptomyces mangrovisoli]|uniref:FAD/NAD(P)-binding protein n=1 Tax=Streptomyces mangrovisoli TaxID=1428628 RepID=UPI000AD52F89|nr:FAD/NAD(P)-binding protein [Streptomyces mangrovisoli]